MITALIFTCIGVLALGGFFILKQLKSLQNTVFLNHVTAKETMQLIADKVDVDGELNFNRNTQLSNSLAAIDTKVHALGSAAGYVQQNGLWMKQGVKPAPAKKPAAAPKATTVAKKATASTKTTKGGK